MLVYHKPNGSSEGSPACSFRTCASAGTIDNEPSIWRYGSVLVKMNNGVAADLAQKWCIKQLEQLVIDTAGR